MIVLIYIVTTIISWLLLYYAIKYGISNSSLRDELAAIRREVWGVGKAVEQLKEARTDQSPTLSSVRQELVTVEEQLALLDELRLELLGKSYVGNELSGNQMIDRDIYELLKKKRQLERLTQQLESAEAVNERESKRPFEFKDLVQDSNRDER